MSERLGEILEREHGLGRADLEEALRVQEAEGRRIGSTLMALGMVSPDAVASALARQKDVPAARRKHFEKIDPRTLELVPRHIAELHRAVPLGITRRGREELIVAMRDPDDRDAIDEIGFFAGMPVRPAVAPELLIEHYLGRLYPATAAAAASSEPEPSIDLNDVTPEPVHRVDIDLPPAGNTGDRPAAADPAAEWGAARTSSRPSPLPESSPSAPASREAGQSSPRPQLMELMRPWLPLVLLVAGAAASVYAARAVGRAKLKSEEPVEVDGPFRCDHVGATITFPSEGGWWYVPAQDQTQGTSGNRAHGAFFYRGGTVEAPDDALVVTVLDSGGRMSELDDREFRLLLNRFARTIRQGPGLLTIRQCKVTGSMFGECTGEARYSKEEQRHLIARIWVESGNLVIAVYTSIDPFEDHRDAIDEMVSSIALD